MLEKLLQKLYYWWVKIKLAHRYRSDLENSKILEEWITKRIIEGQKGRREELQKMQARISELKRFIKHLKKI
jgi:hypothetical protein